MAEISNERFNLNYESDAAKSYLVVGASADEKVENYQVEMIANNPNPNILPLDVRYKDDKVNFYYTITSKITLSQFLKRKKLKRNEFIEILAEIERVLLESKNFLLSDKSFLIDEEYIYINPNSLEVSLAYIPLSFEGDSCQVYKEFVVKLIMYSADIDESNSDNFLQRILSYTKMDNFNLVDFDKLMKELKGAQFVPSQNVSQRQDFTPSVSEVAPPAPSAGFQKPDAPNRPVQQAQPIKAPNMPAPPVTQGNQAVPRPNAVNPNIPNAQRPNPPRVNPPQANFQQAAPQRQAVETTTKKKFKQSTVITGIIAFAAIFIVMVGVLVSGALKKVSEDTVTTYGIFVLVMGLAAFLAYRIIFDKKNMVDTVVEKKVPVAPMAPAAPMQQQPINMAKREIRNIPQGPQNNQPVQPNVPVQNFNAPNQGVQNAGGPVQSVQQAPRTPANNQVFQDATSILSMQNSNDTVILGYSKPNSAIPFLQSKKDGVLEEIRITKPSFIIGRMREQVDYVSQNNAVGKIHAEIVTRDGSYFIKDLNSRNGTFLNDTRVDCNKEYEIKNNDKIAFANSEYIFIIP